jgi:hypothetical protein
MKPKQQACVVLSDYPIKTMAYQRFLAGLGEAGVHVFQNLDADFSALEDAKLVVCDMNIMEDQEAEAMAHLEEIFPGANILFLQEDHSDMRVRFSNNRDICCLGKLSENSVLRATLKELLLQAGSKKEKPLPRRPVHLHHT